MGECKVLQLGVKPQWQELQLVHVIVCVGWLAAELPVQGPSHLSPDTCLKIILEI